MSKTAVHDLRRPPLGFRPRRALALLVSVVAAVSALAVVPPASRASATGCTASGFGIKWFSSAYTCIDIEGPPMLSGWFGHDRPSLVVSTAQVSWVGAGNACNWKMVLRWTNVNGRVYRTDNSRVHVGCSLGRAVYGVHYGRQVYSSTYGWYWSGTPMRTGRVCGYLYESGALRPGVPCEAIHP